MNKIYRTAIVGGRRGLYHAACYEGIENMKIAALCEKDKNLLDEGAKKLGVPGYSDYEEMLEKEKPDIVHAVTSPVIKRSVWVEAAARHNVKALVIEKPIALTPSELAELDAIIKKTNLKVIVNMQRRYMPFNVKFKELIDAGQLGDIHFFRGNCETIWGVVDIATHLIDCMLYMMNDSQPSGVWASVNGANDFNSPTERGPDNLIAVYSFKNGARGFVEAVKKPLGTANFPIDLNDFANNKLEPWQPERCNLDVWTTKGRFWWREYGTWGYQTEGMAMPFTEKTFFAADDISAQKEFTRAISSWLDDGSKPHLNRYELARVGAELIFGAYRSALDGKYTDLPAEFGDGQLEQLKNKLIN